MEPPRQRRIPRSTLLIAVLFVAFCAAAVIVAVVATSGDDGGDGPSGAPTDSGTPPTADPNAPTLAGYIERLQELGTELDDRVAELQTQLTEDLAAEDDEIARLELVKQNFLDTAAANEEFVTGLEDIGPPDTLSEQHTSMVEAGQAYVAKYREVADLLEAATEFDDVEPIIRDPAFEEQRSAFLATCASLADAVEGLGQPVEFFC